MDDDPLLDDNKRQNERVRMDLPIQARIGEGDHNGSGDCGYQCHGHADAHGKL